MKRFAPFIITAAIGMMSSEPIYPTYSVGKPKRRRTGGRLSVMDLRAVPEDLLPCNSKRRTRRLRGKGE